MNQEEPQAAPPDDPVRGGDDGARGATPRKLVAWPLLFSGVVLPLICFVSSFDPGPNWQSGSYSDYAQLLLSRKSSAPLYPFLLYSMTCTVLLFWRPGRFSEIFLVRVGIFCGVLVAAEYWLIFQIAVPELNWFWQVTFSALTVLVLWCVWRVAVILYRRGHRRLLLVFVVTACMASLYDFPSVFAVCYLFSLWFSTPWAPASYVIVAIGLIRGRETSRFRFSLEQLLGVVGLLAAHLAAWRVSFLWMLDEYSRLPATSPSTCFVCTAVAKGHPGVVHSDTYETSSGATFRVNDQLRYLKALELLLASISPGIHRQCRRAYDGIGPWAAALLFKPLLADVGYFLLKPLEWCARMCLVLAIPKQMDLVHALYRTAKKRA